MSELSSKKILVVDDEPMLREILRDVLEFEGAVVLEASNGLEAFELLQKERFDAVISDIRMPGGDGIELLKKVRAQESSTPIMLLITGFSDLSVDSAYDIGADGILSKPFDVSDLLSRIKTLMMPLEKRVEFAPEPMPEKRLSTGSDSLVSFGRGGFCLQEQVNCMVGDLVSFELPLPAPNTPLKGCGVVRWLRRASSEQLPEGVGVEFVYLSKEWASEYPRIFLRDPPKAFIPKQAK